MEIGLEKQQSHLLKKGILYLPCRVIPKSKNTELVDIFINENGEETLKIRLRATPEKGKANKELCSYLAKIFNVPKQNVSITSGQTNRTKIIKILASPLP